MRFELEEKVGRDVYRSGGPTCDVRGRFVATMTETDRFWSKVDLSRLDGCWLWTGPLNGDGYPRFWTPGGYVQAHRYAYELLVGPIGLGLTLDHLCETPACVRPDHLDPCTNADNLRRRHARQRAKNGAIL